MQSSPRSSGSFYLSKCRRKQYTVCTHFCKGTEAAAVAVMTKWGEIAISLVSITAITAPAPNWPTVTHDSGLLFWLTLGKATSSSYSSISSPPPKRLFFWPFLLGPGDLMSELAERRSCREYWGAVFAAAVHGRDISCQFSDNDLLLLLFFLLPTGSISTHCTLPTTFNIRLIFLSWADAVKETSSLPWRLSSSL